MITAIAIVVFAVIYVGYCAWVRAVCMAADQRRDDALLMIQTENRKLRTRYELR